MVVQLECNGMALFLPPLQDLHFLVAFFFCAHLPVRRLSEIEYI